MLEFGSGVSSALIAHALVENGAGHLWTVDAEPSWADVTERALPERRRRNATVVRSERVAEDRDVLGWLHSNVPDVIPEIVYVDGPNITRERQVAFDVVDLAPRLPVGCLILVDGRRENVAYLRAQLGRPHRFRRYYPWWHSFEITA